MRQEYEYIQTDRRTSKQVLADRQTDGPDRQTDWLTGIQADKQVGRPEGRKRVERMNGLRSEQLGHCAKTYTYDLVDDRFSFGALFFCSC